MLGGVYGFQRVGKLNVCPQGPYNLLRGAFGAFCTTSPSPFRNRDLWRARDPRSLPSVAHVLNLSLPVTNRRRQGLPADLSRAVFANFNKIDKLDPESFFLWMQILRRVPGSVLWLLEPGAADTEVGLRSAFGKTSRKP